MGHAHSPLPAWVDACIQVNGRGVLSWRPELSARCPHTVDLGWDCGWERRGRLERIKAPGGRGGTPTAAQSLRVGLRPTLAPGGGRVGRRWPGCPSVRPLSCRLLLGPVLIFRGTRRAFLSLSPVPVPSPSACRGSTPVTAPPTPQWRPGTHLCTPSVNVCVHAQEGTSTPADSCPHLTHGHMHTQTQVHTRTQGHAQTCAHTRTHVHMHMGTHAHTDMHRHACT